MWKQQPLLIIFINRQFSLNKLCCLVLFALVFVLMIPLLWKIYGGWFHFYQKFLILIDTEELVVCNYIQYIPIDDKNPLLRKIYKTCTFLCIIKRVYAIISNYGEISLIVLFQLNDLISLLLPLIAALNLSKLDH